MASIVMIAAAEARGQCKDEPDVIERVKKAMKACRNHWMVTDENEQFRAAVAAAMLESDPVERERIERSAQALNKVGAMLKALQAGVPVDIEAMAAEKQDEDIIPLNKLWHDTAT